MNDEISAARQAVIHRLNELSDHDAEASHIEADSLIRDWLRSIGETDVADAHAAAADRIGFWYA